MKAIIIYSIGHGRKAFLALFIFSLIFFFNFYSNDSISKGISAVAAPATTPTPESSGDLFGIALDKENVCVPCPPGGRPLAGCDTDMVIKVTTSASNSEDDSAVYDYTISGGQIVGAGAKVAWDLTGAQPGTYTISVKVKDKSGIKQMATAKSITVEDRCILDCNCPTLSVDAPIAPVKVGDTLTFTANVSGGAGEVVTYKWMVTGGKIIEGQGTPVIRVKVNPKMAGKVVTATVEIGGVCEECPKTASASGQVAAKKRRDK